MITDRAFDQLHNFSFPLLKVTRLQRHLPFEVRLQAISLTQVHFFHLFQNSLLEFFVGEFGLLNELLSETEPIALADSVKVFICFLNLGLQVFHVKLQVGVEFVPVIEVFEHFAHHLMRSIIKAFRMTASAFGGSADALHDGLREGAQHVDPHSRILSRDGQLLPALRNRCQ